MFSIITSLATYTRAQGLNSTIALLQPPPEVIDLFDDLILLSEGTVVYHVRSPCSYLRMLRDAHAIMALPFLGECCLCSQGGG
jgi:hypothetical protein